LDLRSAITSSYDLISDFPIPSLAASTIIPDFPMDLPSLLKPAALDELNPPLTEAKSSNFGNSTFVDDNGVLALRSQHMRGGVTFQQSLLSALLIFDMPGNDRRGVCLQDDKWDPAISHIMLYLASSLIDKR
jgi:hypothetical protein